MANKASFAERLKESAEHVFSGRMIDLQRTGHENRGTLTISNPGEIEPILILNFNYHAGAKDTQPPAPEIISLEFLGDIFDGLVFEGFTIDCQKKWKPAEKMVPNLPQRKLTIESPKSPKLLNKLMRACKFALDHYPDPQNG